jgi:hypothetical protein
MKPPIQPVPGNAPESRQGESRAALTVEMLAAAGASAEDGIWLDVIRKMDEVYNDLLQYEVAWRKKRHPGGHPAVHLLGADLDVRPADRLQSRRGDRKRQ